MEKEIEKERKREKQRQKNENQRQEDGLREYSASEWKWPAGTRETRLLFYYSKSHCGD